VHDSVPAAEYLPRTPQHARTSAVENGGILSIKRIQRRGKINDDDILTLEAAAENPAV
jgi:hypothetical protein